MNFIIIVLLVGAAQADPACVKEITRLAEIFVANRTQCMLCIYAVNQ